MRLASLAASTVLLKTEITKRRDLAFDDIRIVASPDCCYGYGRLVAVVGQEANYLVL
jgi:hypothetical protein